METNAKILIADENSAQRQSLLTELRRAGYKNTEIATNGEDALKKIERHHPDVVIIDVWLSRLDGIGVIRRCQKLDFGQDNVPTFIVVSLVSNHGVFVEATNAGADLCLLKPYNTESLLEHIASLINIRKMAQTVSDYAEADAPTPDIEAQVTKILHELGIPAHIKGYQYLRTAIMLTISNSEIINSVTKVLYPYVAEKYQSADTRVERAIRHAIQVAWERGDKEILRSYFGCTVQNERGKPTNSEFIAMVADNVRLKYKLY